MTLFPSHKISSELEAGVLLKTPRPFQFDRGLELRRLSERLLEDLPVNDFSPMEGLVGTVVRVETLHVRSRPDGRDKNQLFCGHTRLRGTPLDSLVMWL